VTKDSDTGFKKIQHTLDASKFNPKVTGTFSITVEMDDKSVLRKVIVDGNVSKPSMLTETFDFTANDTQTQAEIPNPKVFAIPKEWGTCHEQPTLFSGIPAMERFETTLNVVLQHITSKAQSDSVIVI